MPRFSSGCPATPAGPLWCFAKEPVRSRVGLSRVQGIGDEYAASGEQDRVIKAFSQRIIAHCSGVGSCQSLPHSRREVFGVGPTYLLRTHGVILRTGRPRREFIHYDERGNQLVRLLRSFRKKTVSGISVCSVSRRFCLQRGQGCWCNHQRPCFDVPHNNVSQRTHRLFTPFAVRKSRAQPLGR